jgi:hypothetical protein
MRCQAQEGAVKSCIFFRNFPYFPGKELRTAGFFAILENGDGRSPADAPDRMRKNRDAAPRGSAADFKGSEGEIVIYKCMDSTCGFVFSRDFEPDRCPSCGRDCIRPATEQEIAEFRQYIANGELREKK